MPREKGASLFDIEQFNSATDSWKGMPEFQQDNLQSFKKIIVHFRNEADFQEFARLINQKLTLKHKTIWFPPMPIRPTAGKEYADAT